MTRLLALAVVCAASSVAHADPTPLTARDLVVATTRAAPAFERCYQRAHVAAGSLEAVVVVAPSGRVRKVRLDHAAGARAVRLAPGR